MRSKISLKIFTQILIFWTLFFLRDGLARRCHETRRDRGGLVSSRVFSRRDRLVTGPSPGGGGGGQKKKSFPHPLFFSRPPIYGLQVRAVVSEFVRGKKTSPFFRVALCSSSALAVKSKVMRQESLPLLPPASRGRKDSPISNFFKKKVKKGKYLLFSFLAV